MILFLLYYVIQYIIIHNVLQYFMIWRKFLMNEDMKPRTFRISESVAEKFRAFCSDFDNQSVALDSLISAYEVQNARAILVDRQTDIADYDTHIQALQNAFLRSLELNENAEQRIRAEFQNMLKSKDEMIMLLQEQNSKLQTKAETAEMEYGTLKQATDARIEEMQGKVSESEKIAQNATERATEALKAREQAEKISAMTAEQTETIKIELQELKDKAEQSDRYKLEVEQLKKQVSELIANAEKIEQERKNTEERYKHDIEVAVKVAIADTKEQYQAKVEEIQKEHARQIAELLAQQSRTVKRAEGKK